MSLLTGSFSCLTSSRERISPLGVSEVQLLGGERRAGKGAGGEPKKEWKNEVLL